MPTGSTGSAGRTIGDSEELPNGFTGERLTHIYVDADACPVKQETYRVAERYGLQVTLVTNSWLRAPDVPWLKVEIVGDAFDAADDWIAEHVQQDDVVITSDIPLAGRCLQAGARVIGPTGKPFTEDNIGAALATRELLAELRVMGEVAGGPPPMGKKDRSNYLQQLDQVIQAILRSTTGK